MTGHKLTISCQQDAEGTIEIVVGNVQVALVRPSGYQADFARYLLMKAIGEWLAQTQDAAP